MKFHFLLSSVLGVLLAVYPISPTLACTSMVVPAEDGGYVYGRTMEFGASLGSNLIVMPRNFPITATGPGQPVGKGGLTWKTKYGATGPNFFNMPLFCEGMNEKGLTGGLFYFPGFAEFQKVPDGKDGQSIDCTELVTYVLTNYATTDEIKELLPKVTVTGNPLASLGGIVPPVHFSFHDSGGKSVVVEYTHDGTLNIYDNPSTVLTNSPPFPQQINNLSQYGNISRYPRPAMEINGTKLVPMGTGSGSTGLPGGFLPDSRFVRAYFCAANAPKMSTSSELVPIVFHLMNQFDIPPGLVGETPEGKTPFTYETSEWTSAADMKNLRYHIRTFGNSQVRFIDLNQVDLDASAIHTVKLDQKETYENLSK